MHEVDMRTALLALLFTVIGATMTAHAKLHTETIDYNQGGKTFEGYLVYDDAVQGPRPGVLVVHEWMGLNDYARRRADMLASLGYVAFAADMYGKGVRPQNAQEASALAGALKGDRGLMRDRVNAAFAILQQQPLVDKKRIAAIGYCFGGTVALELARSGADIAGVVSFHGGLDTPNPNDAQHIKGKVLALHGADDPNVPPAQVAAFEDEMRKAKVDWQLVKYGGAVHAFTNPASGNDNAKGAAYNAAADRRSWEAMKTFFDEIFAK
jgi:dienelactone hydrolase